MFTQFKIDGMTCESCVKTITERFQNIPDVTTVVVTLADKSAQIESPRAILKPELEKALVDLPKYKVLNAEEPQKNPESQSFLKTYKPLFLVFGFIFLVSLSYQASLDSLNAHLFMNHIMAGFFIGLGFFKFLDLNAFSESFSSYDPIAQRLPIYGLIYPFIEVLLGLLFISGKFLLIANMLTIIVLSITTVGVYKRLQSKSKFQCACLGTGFNLPLSNITIGENLAMIAMATTSFWI